jgi:hypothetical protein
MLYFVHMCRNVFNVQRAVKPAPPRIRLKRFTGSLSIEEFRKRFDYVESIVIEPPFVQSTLVVRERAFPKDEKSDSIIPTIDEEVVNSGTMFQTSTQPLADSGLYAHFIENKNAIKPNKPVPVKEEKKKKRVNTDVNNNSGSLNKFVKFGG